MENQQRPDEAIDILKRYWGYSAFREGQWEIISQVLSGRDVLGILPTGGGKSICYQVPAMLSEGVTLVISPLIALMQDQVERLERVGISAVCINSTRSAREIDQAWTDAEFGRYKLVYMAPERIASETFQARAHRLGIRLVAIDEAHCVSEWGLNFRPSYLRIAELREVLPGDVAFAAFTATATPVVQDDIRAYLKLDAPFEYVQGYDRPNVTWSIFDTENKRAKVVDILKGVPGSGILYAATRRSVEEWSSWLEERGEEAALYHGGMGATRREREARAWLSGKKRLMVATNAFGMGIDKPDVRFVIHVDMPGALESYYQEAGRAGRDKKRAHAVLLYQKGDEETQQGLIEDGHPPVSVLKKVYETVCDHAQVAPGDHPDFPVPVHVTALAHQLGLRPAQVRAAVELLNREGVWSIAPAKQQAAQLRVMQPVAVLRAFSQQVQNDELRNFIEVLLRTVSADAFSEWWEVPLRDIERKASLTREQVFAKFEFLQSRELVEWIPPGMQLLVFLQHARSKQLVVDHTQNKKAKKRAMSRLSDMKRYIHSVSCRRHFLLKYFGESSPERCGRCDVCLGRHEMVVITPDDEPSLRSLMQLIHEEKHPSGWDTALGISQRTLDGYTRWLLQEEYIVWRVSEEAPYELTPKARQFLEEWEKQHT